MSDKAVLAVSTRSTCPHQSLDHENGHVKPCVASGNHVTPGETTPDRHGSSWHRAPGGLRSPQDVPESTSESSAPETLATQLRLSGASQQQSMPIDMPCRPGNKPCRIFPIQCRVCPKPRRMFHTPCRTFAKSCRTFFTPCRMLPKPS